MGGFALCKLKLPTAALKVNFTNQSLFTGLGEYHCICEESCLKALCLQRESHKMTPLESTT